MPKWTPFQDAAERATVNRRHAERCGGGVRRLRKLSDLVPAHELDDFDFALELADAYFRFAISAMQERSPLSDIAAGLIVDNMEPL